ncbi:N-acetyltransferase 10, partial [Camelus ferus]
GKLDDYQERMNKGERLNQDQLDAVSKYQEVTNNLEFAKELQRSFMALSQDIQKTIKKTARREQLMREEAEQKRLKTVLELQYVLDKLGDDEVRTDLKQGLNGVPILSEEELSLLDEFYKLADPERDMSLRLNEQYEHASIHLWDLLEGKEKPVCGTTYKALKEIVERVFQSNYFDSTHNHQNGLCEEEEAASAPAAEDQVSNIYFALQYVNRQFMAETQFSSGEKEQADEWTVETVEVVNSLQQQPQAASPSVPEPHSLTPVAQADPLVRRQRVQDLMAQMQGPYNFIQDSMLDFENQTLDPAIVSAQPMNPAQNMDIPQLVCPPVHSESRLAQPNQVSVQPEATQATISLNTDQTTAASSLPAASQPQVFQAGTSKPLHSSGINVNAAPFQSMQTVFNMNAPVPPVNEPETLKQQNQYQASYNQSFSSQPHQVEQTELQQEQLQTVVGTYHGSQDQPHQVTGNHQQPPQQNTGFPRSSQPYYNSRGVSRGGSRGARGLMNGYRGPANGFRGGYDGYRPSFSNTPNSGYTQSQFSAPRDYSGYQRFFTMHRKKVDNRIRILIENGVAERQRSLFVVVGDRGKDQVVLLHHMLSKATVKARPSVLWCYKKELGFSSHRKKRMRQLQKKIKNGTLNIKQDDPFELFVAATNIRYCYYNETHKILGNTFGMCVLQDFEALTPNLLARTVETVEGGGLVVILLRTMNSLRQLYTMTMDVHSRYRTEAHQDVVGRFNERFILSLASCKKCLVIDDQLNILPISSHAASIEALPPQAPEESLGPSDLELKELKESLQDTQPVGVLVDCCRTLDQAKAVLKFIEGISEKTLRSTVALTAARGRGKSAALGLAIAGAVAFGVQDREQHAALHAAGVVPTAPSAVGFHMSAAQCQDVLPSHWYSNIFVTSPSPDNLHTLFEFVFKGFDALQYQEHLDYEIIQSLNPEFNKAVIRVNVFREHRQTIQYIHPADAVKLGQAELVVIDEAAAIPLPLVKSLLGPYLVFMASTINGYEGTGRSLSLKLIQQLRQQSAQSQVSTTAENKTTTTARLASARTLHEVSLQESIRYAPGDAVEKWLNDLLCLDCLNITRIISGCPLPEACELPSYYVNRDTLFCYHKASEVFLQRLMALYVASHYKNSPNDLQMLSDAPAHHLFCLLPPVPPTQNALPEVLAVIQVCLEGEISRQSILNSLSRGKKASGDLIPWTVSEQFQDPDFGGLSGGRVVRIAVHPDYQGMGYGSRALQLLQLYYESRFPCLEEKVLETSQEIHTVSSEAVSLLEEVVTPRKDLPPLLLKLNERPAERLDYLGVSYGLTPRLLKFWKRAGFVPVYLRQTPNDLTGEHSCIMLKTLTDEDEGDRGAWLSAFWKDFRRRFLALLSYQFSTFSPPLALNILQNRNIGKPTQPALRREELEALFLPYDLKRLEMYSRNMVDYHLIMDMIPAISRMYFLNQLGDLALSAAQSALLLGIGLQHKSVDQLEKEIELPSGQLMGLFNRIIRKVVKLFNEVQEKAIEEQMVAVKDVVMEPTMKTLSDELDEAAKEFQEKHKKEVGKLKDMDLSQYVIRGDDEEWNEVLNKAGQNASIISLKSDKKRKLEAKKEPKQNKKLKKNRDVKNKKDMKLKQKK